jgi:hypothetical protein
MAITFPTSPSLNDTHTVGNITWTWNGSSWTAAQAGSTYGDTNVATYLNGNLDTHILPDTNSTYDIGSAEYKIRHLFLSDNSLKFVDETNTEFSLGAPGGVLTFNGEAVGGGGGGGLKSRSIVTGNTNSLADAAEADLDITGFKAYALLAITTDRAARVRLYVSAATRTADASRAEGVDPTSDAGLIAEVITTGADTVIISPGAYGFNLESSPTTTIPCRVTNKSGGTATVQITLNVLQLEA